MGATPGGADRARAFQLPLLRSQTNRILGDVEDGLLSCRQHLLGETEKILEIFANLLVIAGRAIVAHVEF
jgi:hypothetical protein